MTKRLFSLVVVSTFILTSCKKELVPQDSAEKPEATTEDTTIATASTVNMTAPQTTIQQPTQVATPAASPTKPGMNPPHGQAGHDCAVAVGAPLNSK